MLPEKSRLDAVLRTLLFGRSDQGRHCFRQRGCRYRPTIALLRIIRYG
jgi:hypothetical protein